MPTLIGIHSYIYEVSDYCNNHPGEGIINIYLKRFHRKNTTDLFERYHNTNEPDELLIEAKNNNFKKTEQGIAFVCPFFFKRRIPKFFHYINNDNLEKYLKTVFLNKKTNSFILRPSFKNNEKTLILTYYLKNENTINHKYLIKENDYWIGSLYYNNNVNCYKQVNVEKLIDKLMKDFEPIIQ